MGHGGQPMPLWATTNFWQLYAHQLDSSLLAALCRTSFHSWLGCFFQLPPYIYSWMLAPHRV